VINLGTAMPVLIVGPSGSGKSTVTLGLALRLQSAGSPVPAFRWGQSPRAIADAQLFYRLGLSPVTTPVMSLEPQLPEAALLEMEGTELPKDWRGAQVRVLGVTRYPALAELEALKKSTNDAFLGAIVNCVPRRRTEEVLSYLRSQQIPLLALLPEDKVLAHPTVGQLAEALGAQLLFAEGQEEMALETVAISSIASDPEQYYVARLAPKAIIVRSDKPDQQLGALNAGICCLIVTGDMPLLSYVLERAEEGQVPVIVTSLGTADVVHRLEKAIAHLPIVGKEKATRAAQLLAAAAPAESVLALLGS